MNRLAPFKIVPGLQPVDTVSNTLYSDVVNLGRYDSVMFTIPIGAISTGNCTLTIEKCDDVVPTTPTAITFTPFVSGALPSDTFTEGTAAASYTVAHASMSGKTITVTVKGEDLGSYGYVRAKIVGGGACLCAIVCILFDGRYAPDMTAIV